MKQAVILAGMLLAGLCNAGEDKQLLWGDTHLHTNNSMDAITVGNKSGDPATAYRYARGLPVIHPYHRARIQIETPLDFLVVSDHAEFIGVIKHVYNEGVPTEDMSFFQALHAMFSGFVIRTAMDTKWGPLLFGSRLPQPEDPAEAARRVEEEGFMLGGIPTLPKVQSAAWADITEAADAYNVPGEFSAMIGWEWSAIPGGANLHRIVVTDSGADKAQQYLPFSFIDSSFPEDLWAWLDETSTSTGADFIAIPHNSNISKGYMFDTKTLRGDPLSPDYIAARMRWEKVVEVTQIKGDSETHPDLSPDDEFADFEDFPFYLQSEPSPYVAGEGDYVRSGLKRGLLLEQEHGRNPYQFGLVGSTDAHTAMASAEEDNFHGKLAIDSIPENKDGMFEAESPDGPFGWDMSASGLAAVWAEENTRESILRAMKRREVYATSGPRIGVRFFAGTGYGEGILEAADLYQQATASGVPMGGELSGDGGEAPEFVVLAEKDPAGANLDRIQIVKGWVDASGTSHEKVFDVAWSGDRQPGADGKLPLVGNTVDKLTASYSNDIGATRLIVRWQDPRFDAGQSAFYYARVLQIPTPRHSLYDAVALGLEHAGDQPDAIQERAYTSPIWYSP